MLPRRIKWPADYFPNKHFFASYLWLSRIGRILVFLLLEIFLVVYSIMCLYGLNWPLCIPAVPGRERLCEYWESFCSLGLTEWSSSMWPSFSPPSLLFTFIFLTGFCVGILFGANIDLIIRKKLNIKFKHTYGLAISLLKHSLSLLFNQRFI